MERAYLYLLLFVVMASCGRFNNKENNTAGSERIVCISKQYSEIIFSLGAEKNIVAVDVSSTYPPEVKKLPTIGYHRALSAEAILAAKPTLVLHDNNIGPEHVVKQLEDMNVPMKAFDAKAEDIAGAKKLIREMGNYFDKKEQADSLCQKLDKDMENALATAAQYKDTPKVLIIHFGQANNVYLVMTKKSTAAKMIGWAGGQMAVDGEKGMRQLSAEVIAASDPDVILLTDFGYDKLGTKEKIAELPGVAGTKAVKNGRIYRIEEHDLVYLGPRTGKNTLLLHKLIHLQ